MLASGKIVRTNPRESEKQNDCAILSHHSWKVLDAKKRGSRRPILGQQKKEELLRAELNMGHRGACLFERVSTEVRSDTFEAKVRRTPYLFLSGLGHCTLITFYGMLSP